MDTAAQITAMGDPIQVASDALNAMNVEGSAEIMEDYTAAVDEGAIPVEALGDAMEDASVDTGTQNEVLGYLIENLEDAKDPTDLMSEAITIFGEVGDEALTTVNEDMETGMGLTTEFQGLLQELTAQDYTVHVHTIYTSEGQPPQTGGSSTTTETGTTGDEEGAGDIYPQIGTGGWFTIPPGYYEPGNPFRIHASSGEEIQVVPRGGIARGEGRGGASQLVNVTQIYNTTNNNARAAAVHDALMEAEDLERTLANL
jgi:hypothetical protein